MKRDGSVVAMKSFQFVMFCLLVSSIIGGDERRKRMSIIGVIKYW
jgi:hypothetical protein